MKKEEIKRVKELDLDNIFIGDFDISGDITFYEKDDGDGSGSGEEFDIKVKLDDDDKEELKILLNNNDRHWYTIQDWGKELVREFVEELK